MAHASCSTSVHCTHSPLPLHIGVSPKRMQASLSTHAMHCPAWHLGSSAPGHGVSALHSLVLPSASPPSIAPPSVDPSGSIAESVSPVTCLHGVSRPSGPVQGSSQATASRRI